MYLIKYWQGASAVILALCMLVLLPACVSTPPNPKLSVIGPPLARSPELAPDLSLPGTDGQMHSIAKYRGKIIIAALWAPWCIPCRYEMPALNRLYTEFKDDGLVILGIGVEDSPISIKGAAKEAGATFPILIDIASASSHLFNSAALPTALIIDRTGHFVLFPDPNTGVATPWIVGPREWDAPEIVSQIKGLLAE